MSKPTRHLSRRLAPDDVRRGDYVAVLFTSADFVVNDCGESWKLGVARLRWMPWETETPGRVLDVCLPFVLVESPSGDVRTLDVRRFELARLHPRFGARAFRVLAPRKGRRARKRRAKRS